MISVVGRPAKTSSSSLRALGRVVLAAGQVGDRAQRLLVDAAPEAAAAAAEPAARRTRRRPGSLPMNCCRQLRVELAALARDPNPIV